MLSVKGVYDGKNILPIEKLKEKKRYKVIITFVEEIKGNQEINTLREFASQTKALDFWKDSKEDIYQDYLPESDK